MITISIREICGDIPVAEVSELIRKMCETGKLLGWIRRVGITSHGHMKQKKQQCIKMQHFHRKELKTFWEEAHFRPSPHTLLPSLDAFNSTLTTNYRHLKLRVETC